VLLVLTFGEEDIFRFNRVEGPYLGYALFLDNEIPKTQVWAAGGYAFDADDWQYRLGFSRDVWKSSRLFVGAEYKNRIVRCPVVFADPRHSSTLAALLFKADPLDYYQEKGLRLFAGLRPIAHTRLRLTYADYKQRSAGVATDYGVFYPDKATRDNPAIVDGHLRSAALSFRYDSRKLIDNKGSDFRMFDVRYTEFTAGIEYASPEFIANDFDFVRYYAKMFRRQRLLGLGITSLEAYWGDADGDLPLQKHFTVDHCDPVFFADMGFKTLDENNFSGSEVFSVYANHDFGLRLFKRSNLPGVKAVPFDLGVHGGMFWTRFDGGSAPADNAGRQTARKPYEEIGFSLSNLAPFLSPFNLVSSFTWQLSDHPTSDFAWQVELKF
jgi:hypothetical protein